MTTSLHCSAVVNGVNELHPFLASNHGCFIKKTRLMRSDGEKIFLTKKTQELRDDRRVSTAVRMHHDLGQNKVACHAEDSPAATSLNDGRNDAVVKVKQNQKSKR